MALKNHRLPPELLFELVLRVPLTRLPLPLINRMLSPWLFARWFYRRNGKKKLARQLLEFGQQQLKLYNEHSQQLMQQLNKEHSDVQGKIARLIDALNSANTLPEVMGLQGQFYALKCKSNGLRCTEKSRDFKEGEEDLSMSIRFSKTDDAYIMNLRCSKVRKEGRFRMACISYVLKLAGCETPLSERVLEAEQERLIINTAFDKWATLEVQTLTTVSKFSAGGLNCVFNCDALESAMQKAGKNRVAEEMAKNRGDWSPAKKSSTCVDMCYGMQNPVPVEFLFSATMYCFKEKKKQVFSWHIKWPAQEQH